jgi:FxsC-like protein
MQPIAAYAKQVVTDLGHQAVLDTVGPPTVGAAESQEAPAILLVDPWVTRDPMFCAELRQIDEDPVNVLTPFNVDDPQTGAAEADLTHRLDSVLGRSLALHGSAVHIPTLEAFRGAVSKAVSEAVTRYFKTTTVHPPQVPPTMARPTLELPEK